jgi:thioredoxin reductase (NADPH)
MLLTDLTSPVVDTLIVGAGPAGIACAIELHRAGIKPVLLEKGCVAQTLINFPTYMRFFTSCEGLEIAGIPMVSVEDRPGRTEAIKYYQRVVSSAGLRVQQYEEVSRIDRHETEFIVTTSRHQWRARTVILATGFFHQPVPLGVPGENLPKTMHFYREPHAYFGQHVMVVGGRNSAGAAAIELQRTGARVTIVHRKPALTNSMKPWLRHELETLIATGQIRVHFNSVLTEILPGAVLLQTPTGTMKVANDFLFALTGYVPDLNLLRRSGVQIDMSGRPVLDQDTFESSVPDVYLAGVIVAGSHTNELNISDARSHAKRIAAHLAFKLTCELPCLAQQLRPQLPPS